MKIGIMTWFLYHNYGTALQVTALSETIKSLGHEPTVINYDPDSSIAVKERENSLGFFVSVKLKLLKRLRRTKIFGVLRSIKHFIMPPMNNNSSYLSDEKREENFNAFLASNISLTDECNTMQQLESTAYKFDTVVCGSDQIWSPLCFDTHYFLDFVHKRTQENTREHKKTSKRWLTLRA